MIFYRVKTENKLYRVNGYLKTVKNEIYTQKELNKLAVPDRAGCFLRQEWLEEVNIPKNKTYWFFGARFGKQEV